MDKQEIKHKELTEKIIGIFFEVYNELGFGFMESVYENAMLIALVQAGLAVEQQVPVPVHFRGKVVGDFRCDLLVEEGVLLELKAVKDIAPEHVAQTLNHLKATDIEVGLILNFGEKPTFKRLVFDKERKKPRIHTD